MPLVIYRRHNDTCKVHRLSDQPGNLYQCDREYTAKGKKLFLWLGKQ